MKNIFSSLSPNFLRPYGCRFSVLIFLAIWWIQAVFFESIKTEITDALANLKTTFNQRLLTVNATAPATSKNQHHNSPTMEYLQIKKSKNQVRADGSPYAVPLFMTKNRKYGKVTSQQTVSIKQPILVTGAHDSGKTRWLTRLHENSFAIWGTKYKASALFLDTLSPLSAWIDNPALAEWWDKHQADKEKNIPPWQKLKQHDRAEALPLYCENNKAVLFIDDAHKLAGRKLQLARQCVMASKIFVISASEEQRLPPNLRSVVMRRKPQIFRLDSEVAYDATKIIMWIVIAGCIAAGFWEGAAVLGGLQALGSGRRSSRAD